MTQGGAGLGRDVEMLEVIAAAEALGQPLGVTRIAQQLDRQKSQVSRALHALELEGMVERDALTRQFRLGWRIHALASQTREARLVQVALPHLRALVQVLQETAHLCVLRGDRVLTLHSELCGAAFRGAGWQGTSVPVQETIAGRALLMDWTEQQLHTRFGAEPALLAAPAQLRRDGWIGVREGLEPLLVGVAAPVCDDWGQVAAAVSVVGTSQRLGDRLDECGRTTASTARAIAAALTPHVA